MANSQQPPPLPAPRWRCLIDGRSGSGKTELGRAMAAAWPEVQLVKLDDFYPGWDGLDAASALVPRILTELRWQEWNWLTDSPGAWHKLDGDRPIVFEGIGALSRASAPLVDHSIWVELDDVSRKKRALDRDGDTYAPHWERWARQELRFMVRENPRELADETLDGADISHWFSRR
ncbi:ATP-binding protein [Salinibacterium sp. NG253]|uniref:ATP-binding protein n=1 Tax=Salinibacterium sp. NG253 TaxID=2792039 RepID=UPI001E545683|nr:ATP-binding protein [Salinibacterium sp. NG253]